MSNNLSDIEEIIDNDDDAGLVRLGGALERNAPDSSFFSKVECLSLDDISGKADGLPEMDENHLMRNIEATPVVYEGFEAVIDGFDVDKLAKLRENLLDCNAETIDALGLIEPSEESDSSDVLSKTLKRYDFYYNK